MELVIMEIMQIQFKVYLIMKQYKSNIHLPMVVVEDVVHQIIHIVLVVGLVEEEEIADMVEQFYQMEQLCGNHVQIVVMKI